jgi:hypothetical protein
MGATVIATYRSDRAVAVVDASQRGGVDPNHMSCCYGTGKVRLDGYWPGRYRLFAFAGDVANGDGVHGSQWVGAHGGTGDLEKAARQVTVARGRRATYSLKQTSPKLLVKNTFTINNRLADTHRTHRWSVA